MANHKHVEILSRGVTAWNEWRSQDLDIKPNLSGANLFKADLTHANLRQTDLRKTDLRESKLNEADLFKADLRNANLRGASAISSDWKSANMTGVHMVTADLSRADLKGADMRGVRLDSSDMYEADLQESNLSAANLTKAHLLSANLSRANLRGCNLAGAVLMIAKLGNADLSLANLTGAKLYGTERDDWRIDGIKCDYAYWDGPGNQRSPADRDYKPGEFEHLYSKSPTIEYPFEDGFTPVKVAVMNRVVKVINHRTPGFELRLDSLMLRGIPRAVFSVLHPKDRPKALSMIHEQYQEQMQQEETREAQEYLEQWDNLNR